MHQVRLVGQSRFLDWGRASVACFWLTRSCMLWCGALWESHNESFLWCWCVCSRVTSLMCCVKSSMTTSSRNVRSASFSNFFSWRSVQVCVNPQALSVDDSLCGSFYWWQIWLGRQFASGFGSARKQIFFLSFNVFSFICLVQFVLVFFVCVSFVD